MYADVFIEVKIRYNTDDTFNQEHIWFSSMHGAGLSLFYILATSKVRSGRLPTCDSAHSWQLYSFASLGHQATGTISCYPTRSHYPDTVPTSPCPTLIMPSVKLGIDKYQF